jgi:hypothetical protein
MFSLFRKVTLRLRATNSLAGFTVAAGSSGLVTRAGKEEALCLDGLK